MSPEEWAKKIRDLILEAEADLDRSSTDGGEYWLVLASDFQLQKYNNNRPTDEHLMIW